MFSTEEISQLFPQIHEMELKGMTYLDSAATNLKLKSVIEASHNYYSKETASVHRGIYTLSEINTDKYEKTRDLLVKLINASSREEIIFTKGTTESINLVALTWGMENINKDDEIIISHLEHHSNIVPWQMLCEKKQAKLKIIPINQKGELIIEEYEKLLSEKTKLVSVNWISNALGTINPIENIINLAKKYHAKVLIDAAQAISHVPINIQKLDCDFLAFSAHKMFGPTGVGALFAKKEIMENTAPLFGGGDMIDTVSFEKTTYNVLPQKFEAGTPNIEGIIAWAPAIEFLLNTDFSKIRNHENELLNYATEKISKLQGLEIIGTSQNKGAVISFTIKGLHAHDIATLLNKYGIAVRTGHHCTQPIMKFFNVPATARASFSIYNTKADIDKFINSLNKIIELFND